MFITIILIIIIIFITLIITFDKTKTLTQVAVEGSQSQLNNVKAQLPWFPSVNILMILIPSVNKCLILRSYYDYITAVLVPLGKKSQLLEHAYVL